MKDAPGILRRVATWSVRLSLAGLVVLLAGYVFRRTLVEPLLKPQLERLLGEALDARVRIDRLEGSWITSVAARGIHVEGGPHAVLRLVERGELAATISPFDLARGDLAGVVRASLRARRVVVGLAAAAPAQDTTEETRTPVFELPQLGFLARLAPEGVKIVVERLRLERAGRVREAPLRAALEAGAGRRRAWLRHGDAALGVVLEPGGRIRARAEVHRPGDLLETLTGEKDPTGADLLRAAVSISDDPFTAAGDLQLDGSRLRFSVDPGQLRIHRAHVRVPGIEVLADGVHGPSPLAARIDPQTFEGFLAIRVHDLTPYVDRLPRPVREAMPIRGRLQGTVRDGRLLLADSHLSGRGIELDIAAGTLPLPSEAAGTTPGRIDFIARLSETAVVDVPGAGRFHAKGRIAGALTGSLERPAARAWVALADVRTPWAGARRFEALLAFTAESGRVSAEDLAVTGLQVFDVHPSAAADLTGGVRIDLPREDSTVTVAFDVSGEARGIAEALAPTRLRAAGELRTGAELPAVRARIALDEISYDHSPPIGLDADLVLAPSGKLEVRPFVTRGALALAGHASLPVSGGGPLDLRVFGDGVALEPIAAWVGLPEGVAGSAHLDVRVEGRASAPRLRADVRVRLAGLFARCPELWPAALGPAPVDPLELVLVAESLDQVHVRRLDLRAGADNRGARLRLRGAGPLPLAFDFDRGVRSFPSVEPFSGSLEVVTAGDPALRSTANLAVDAAWMRLDRIEVAAADGRVHGRAALALPDSNPAGFDQLMEAALEGKLVLDDFDLRNLPGELTGLPALEGKVAGDIRISGTPAAPSPVARLAWRDGAVKLAGALQRIENLNVRLSVDPAAVVVEDMRGEMAAGRFFARGSIRHPGGRLLFEPGNARIHLSIRGQDLLLVRGGGVKIRGHTDVTLTGTPDKVTISGRVRVTSGKFLRSISLIPDIRARGSGLEETGLVLFRLPPEIGRRLEFDVAIVTERPFEVRTRVFDGELDTDLRLRGSGELPFVVGTISGTEGVLRFPGSTMRLENLLLGFPEERPLYPDLFLRAEGRRWGIRTQLTVTGRYGAEEFLLSSIPPLPYQDLIVLVTTGVMPKALRERGMRGQAMLAGTYLIGELVSWLFASESTERNAGFFDRFEFESGRELSRSGTETLQIDFRLDDEGKFRLRAERDVYEDYNMGVVYRLRF